MRRSWMVVIVCAAAVCAACAPAEKPVADEPSETEISVAAEPIQPGDPPPGSFESGDTRGWANAQGDDSRTDFETGDTTAWSDTRGSVEEGAAKEDDDDGR